MINLLKTLTRRIVPSAAPRESVSAGHGLHSPNSPATATTLPPHRRGRLKNGNRAGDFLAAPRCGARTRCGGACRQPAMPNGRCRLHGGLSAGPRTPAGLARSRRARWKHGARSAAVRALLRAGRQQTRCTRALRARLAAFPAGHGVHRSVFAQTLLSGGPLLLSDSASLRLGVSAVNPVSAGHGVHRSIFDSRPALR
jgi:hypothetical protein